MRVAFGFKAHSGWSALVVLAAAGNDYDVVDRRRVELVEAANAAWSGQPYHAADGLPPGEARRVVKRAVEAAHRVAEREMEAAVQRARASQQQIVACAVLTPDPMPEWSTEEILAVHFRMHQAEGVLFPDALAKAALACGLKLVTIREKKLWEQAERDFATPVGDLLGKIAALGKVAGPPWGKDQKNAAVAAMMALRYRM